MGLFSSKTRIYVNSSVYNLAGEYDARKTNTFPALVLGSVLGDMKGSFARSLQRGIRQSQANRQRQFFAWAKDHYELGMPEGYVTLNREADRDVVRSGMMAQMNLESNQTLEIIAALIDGADEEHWAEAWVKQNRPLQHEEEWSPYYDKALAMVSIDFGNSDVITFPAPEDLIWGLEDRTRRILYAAYRIITRDPVTGTLISSTDRLFTYRLGSGNVVFDTLEAADEAPVSEFFPCIPMRVNNESVANLTYFDNVAKAYRKLTGSSIDSLLEQIEDNEDIDDIDYCFLVMGVSLNTEDQSGRRFLYEFFRSLIEMQQAPTTYAQMAKKANNTFQDSVPFTRWERAQNNQQFGHPKYTDSAPNPRAAYVPPTNELRIQMPDFTPFSLHLEWNSIREFQRVGNAALSNGETTPMKVGKVSVTHQATSEKVSPDNLYRVIHGALGRQDAGVLILRHQYARYRYRELVIEGLVHRNSVYGGKKVKITAKDAMEDDEESAFLIPLHRPTLNTLGTRHGIQMSTANSYLMFNVYEKQRVKWYQRGFFKVILVVAGIALAAFTGGGSLAASAGILGTNAAVGALIGATGAMAAVVGAVANAIAATVIANLVSKVSVTMFGEKFGAIIGTIATFVAMTYAGQYSMNGDFNVDWGKIMRIDNLMGLTNSVTSGYSQFMAADTAAVYDEMSDLATENSEALKEIEALRRDILGMTAGTNDPIVLTDAREQFGESPEAFLSRTLLTGSDLAELTHALIEDFADISLKLPELSQSTAGFQ